MRLKIALVLVVSFGLLIAYLSALVFLSPRTALEKEGLDKSEDFLVKTEIDGIDFHLGDAISYSVQILYNPAKIDEIDKSGLDQIMFEPFSIINSKTEDFQFNSRTRIYSKTYSIQLLDGSINKLYNFPAINIRYKPEGQDWVEKAMVPEPIFIGARLPDDIKEFNLKPLKGSIIDSRYQDIPVILWIVATFCIVFGIAEISRRFAKRGRKNGKEKEQLNHFWIVYGELCQMAEAKGDFRVISHRAHQLLRSILAEKEGIDWLEPNLEKLPSIIKRLSLDIFSLCQKTYSPEEVSEKEVREILQKLKYVLGRYTKKRGGA